MAALLLIALIGVAPLAGEEWTAWRSGPFEVLSDGGEKQAREVLNAFDQARFTLGMLLGKTELATRWPVRIVVYKPDRQRAGWRTKSLRLVRDRYVAGLERGAPVPQEFLRDCVRILLEANTQRMPASIDMGLEELFSTLEARGNRVTLGAPPPPERRTRDWARIHRISVDPEYRGRARVFYSNLQQDADRDAAYRNSFGKREAEMEAEIERYLAGGQFAAEEIAAKPVNPESDYRPREVESATARLAAADLVEGEAARIAYQSILNEFPKNPEALEGLGLYTDAAAAGSRAATAWLALGASLQEPAKAWDAFQQAGQLNPRWAEPHSRMASMTKDPQKRIQLWKKAAEIEPRNARHWQELAEAELAVKAFANAAIAWRSAERAAATAEERERIRRSRLSYEERRAGLEEAERRRLAEEAAREIARLKEDALREVRAAEARANQGAGPASSRKPVEWWDGPRPTGKASGLLERVDCVGRTARLVIRGEARKLMQLAIRDPAKIVILGGGEQTLGCGPQKPPRKVTVEYTPQPDARLGTIGEAALIEFQ